MNAPRRAEVPRQAPTRNGGVAIRKRDGMAMGVKRCAAHHRRARLGGGSGHQYSSLVWSALGHLVPVASGEGQSASRGGLQERGLCETVVRAGLLLCLCRLVNSKARFPDFHPPWEVVT